MVGISSNRMDDSRERKQIRQIARGLVNLAPKVTKKELNGIAGKLRALAKNLK